jgi:hypothetical protein
LPQANGTVYIRGGGPKFSKPCFCNFNTDPFGWGNGLLREIIRKHEQIILEYSNPGPKFLKLNFC